MQHKSNGRESPLTSEVDVADDTASHRRILSKILDNLDQWNLRISAVDIKLTYHQVFGLIFV